MTVKSYSPYRALIQPAAYFSSLVRTYPNNGRIFVWFLICSFIPVLCTLASYKKGSGWKAHRLQP
ncbi:hypothetical protein [Deinococcus cellulosilyticus]|uniref:Uncharacterized protein n=1 Tax=Deinococcus cellulosilyticus (strain DSM 18568 / NBRC 106333 / KACC 11606 / 5516J-15) TaxID=1223518 RepID=A0A511N986_DEIC1|nr:hypothetical protein [Deinococcus cellulosilyticus]GEM49360.1 hypothetical protein DC3_49950 [Deinococcus cellulosilyticus NBRC 106333 = KACC 11606]